MPLAARIGRAIGKLFLAGVVLVAGIAVLPQLLSAAMEQLVPSVDPSVTPPPASSSTSPPAVKAATPPAGKKTTAKAKPSTPGPPDCANASAAEITKVIGRRVQPISVSTGCAWGTRLDDPSTTLVTIRMSESHSAYDTQLVTSVKQRRVVYGIGYDAGFQQGTALWVATGQPITKGKDGVRARADTHVLVARTALNVSDDRARQMALAIAAAANGTS